MQASPTYAGSAVLSNAVDRCCRFAGSWCWAVATLHAVTCMFGDRGDDVLGTGRQTCLFLGSNAIAAACALIYHMQMHLCIYKRPTSARTRRRVDSFAPAAVVVKIVRSTRWQISCSSCLSVPSACAASLCLPNGECLDIGAIDGRNRTVMAPAPLRSTSLGVGSGFFTSLNEPMGMTLVQQAFGVASTTAGSSPAPLLFSHQANTTR